MRVNTSKILVLIKQKEKEYRELLEAEDPILLDRAFSFIEYRKDLVAHNVNIPFNESIQKLDRGTQRIFELMEQYAQELKKIFVENGGILTHITDISPENMKDRRIKKSFNRANNYETECGNWLFASSTAIDGENLYIARKREGMICLTDTIYIFGGDNFIVEPDENGNNHMYLKEPNYIYFIEPTNFSPVVILKRDSEGKPYFEFSEEWISDKEVSIDNPEEVLDIEEVREITDLLYTYQIFCDTKMQGVARRIIKTQSIKRGAELLNEYTDNNDLLYMNGIAEINISPIMKSAYFEEWKKRILLEIKYHFEGEIEYDIFKRIENGELSEETAKAEKEIELEKRIQEYINKNGGIEHIVNARITVLNTFDNVINTYRRLKDVPYFYKKEELESALREFYNSIKVNYSNVECFWEYSQYINMIREISVIEKAYPFIEEIQHPQSEEEPYKTLDSLVELIRNSVCRENNGTYSFYNKCVECQKELNTLISGKDGISNKSLDTQYNMGLPSFQHSFNLVKIDGKFFIIDPTYIQFCDISYTTDVLGVPGLSAGNPGMYLMQDKMKLEFLRNLIRNGYFEATEENVKMYFDSFVLANRNIEFYRNHGGASTMSTDISAREYIRAILEGKKVSFGNPKELGSAQDISEHKEFFE